MEALESRLLLDAVRMPWVAGVTETSVWVCLEATNNTQDATVYYGETDSYGLTATTDNTQLSYDVYGYYVHNIQLTGLQPNKQYHYKVTHGSSESADAAFWTAPQPGTAVRWGFAADCRSGPGVHNQTAGHILSYDPRMMVYGGDLCHWGAWSEWDGEWFVANQEALNAVSPFVNAPGNHEGWNDRTKAFTQSPTGDPDYFSFDYGDAHILVLNNMVDYSEGSAQWNFAAADLAASTKPWKIVTSHFQTYAGGEDNADMINMATQIFVPNGVDLVLQGHRHYYQHNLVNGIHYMIIGSFGAPLYTPYYGPYTIYTEMTFCFGIFDMTPWRLTLNTYRNYGTHIETIVLDNDTTPPTAPTGVSATGVSESQMWLEWTAAEDPDSPIDHYKIYRDSELVGTTVQACYLDEGLDTATGYTYEISAVNAVDLEGAKSSPVGQSTLADTTPPEIYALWSAWPTEAEVMFSEPVEEATAEVAGNYTIAPSVSVSSATLLADNKTVRLGVSTLSQSTTYTVTVNNVRDRATSPNTIAADSQATFEYVPWSDQDVGSCSPAGSMSYAAGQYTINSNGADIGGTADAFHYVYRTLDGEGEIISRVVNDAGLSGAKSGVMMRDSLSANSPEVSAMVGAVGTDLINYYPFDSDLDDHASDYLEDGGSTETDLTAYFGGGTPTVRYASGKVGNALQVRVVSDDIQAARSAAGDADIDLGDAFTAEMWLYPTAFYGGWSWLIFGLPWTFQYNTAPYILFSADDGQNATGGSLNLNEWQHIAAVADPATGRLRIYRNGVEVVNVAYDGEVDSPIASSIMDIGSSHGAPDKYSMKGYMDEVALWGEALQEDVVLAHYNAGSAGYGLTSPSAGASGVWYLARESTGGDTSAWSPYNVDVPYHTKLVRLNGEFVGYVSQDGETWSQVGPGTAPADMAGGPVYFGLAASSHAYNTLGTFYQDNVKIIEYGPNTAPAGSADSYCVNQDAHLNVAPSRGVLANDTDTQGDALEVVLVSDVSHGTLTLYANGCFGYTPQAGYSGADSFAYKAGDGRAQSSEVTVSINVAALGNIPGDANRDDTVDGQDFTMLKANYGDYGCWDKGDFNSDGIADGQDFTILKAYYGQSVSPPAGSAAASESTQAAGEGSETLSAFAAGVFAARQSASARPTPPGLGDRPAARALASRRLGPMGLVGIGIRSPAASSAAGPLGNAAVASPAVLSALAAAAGDDAPALELDLDPGLVDVLAAEPNAELTYCSSPR